MRHCHSLPVTGRRAHIPKYIIRTRRTPWMNIPLLDAVNALIQCSVHQENCASVHCATHGVRLMRPKSCDVLEVRHGRFVSFAVIHVYVTCEASRVRQQPSLPLVHVRPCLLRTGIMTVIADIPQCLESSSPRVYESITHKSHHCDVVGFRPTFETQAARAVFYPPPCQCQMMTGFFLPFGKDLH